MSEVKVGDSFHVSEETAFEDGEIVIANYLPGLHYRVTGRNISFVTALVKKKVATLGDVATGTPSVLSAGKTRVRAKIGVKK